MKQIMAFILVFLSFCQGVNAATVTNGNFNAGLTGWTALGNVSVSSTGYAVLTSEGSSTDTGFFGGSNGSILTQTINAVAGNVISFNYNFITIDSLPYNDFSLVVADGNRLIADVLSVGNIEGNTSETGWKTFSFVAASDFTNLSFILSNSIDDVADSTLFVDNVQVAATPIPAAIWLFGSAFAGLMGLSHKKKVSA